MDRGGRRGELCGALLRARCGLLARRGRCGRLGEFEAEVGEAADEAGGAAGSFAETAAELELVEVVALGGVEWGFVGRVG